ncbi:MAG: asparagine synthase [Tumebacillaceae bacterium]
MYVREGLVPTVLGAAVTAAGVTLRAKNTVNKEVATGLAAFGAAHVVLGVIDLVEHRNRF